MDSVDTLWLIVATFLVLLMQPGFLMLEGGRVRSKNSINVAQKNATDLIVVWVCYLCLGYYLMYGYSAPDLFSPHDSALAPSPLHFVFQFGFACTTATILSGAIAERMSYRAYLVLVAVMACLFYPLAGKFVWGATYDPGASAFLGDLGFVDFAGSTVVHGVGAWFGLVGLLMIGPRIGRFDEHGKPQILPAHNAVIALYGVLLLMLAWIGFNGGMVSPGDPLLQSIVFNTMNGAAFGALAGLVVGVWLDNGVFNPSRVTSGLLGGLVACTAGVHVMSAHDSMVVGALGGLVATVGSHVLLHRFKLDDPLDVVATHGIAGVFGTLAVAFVGPVSALPAGGRLQQLFIQAFGVVVVFTMTCAGCWLTIRVLSRFTHVRVPEQAEQIGLNYTEHGESIGLARLQEALESQADGADSFRAAALIDADDEQSELAVTLNKVMGRYEEANRTISAANRRFQQFAETASDWLWETDDELRVTFVHANSDIAADIELDRMKGCHFFEQLDMEAAVKQQLSLALMRRTTTLAFEAKLTLKHTGEPVLRSMEVRGMPFLDADNEFAGYRGTMTDITVRKTAEERALFLSMHDELTRLPNRRALARDLEQARSDTNAQTKAIVVAGVDLDGFKAVNDVHGHLVGDELLKQVARRLQQFLRHEDSAYRIGGDEFVVVLNDLGNQSAVRVANAIMERLIAELGKPYCVQTHDIRIGASAGISCYPLHGNSVEDMLRMADLALYSAKDRGKGCVVEFDTGMDISSTAAVTDGAAICGKLAGG